MAKYTREQFLDYYDFKDEPEKVPNLFIKKYKSYEKLIENVGNDVRRGVKLLDAIRLNAGITNMAVNQWKNAFIKEMEDGKTDTPLIRLFSTGLKSDAVLYRKIMGLVVDKAEEGDTNAMIYLAKHRLGYNSTKKQEVELSTKDDFSFNINITESENNDGD